MHRIAIIGSGFGGLGAAIRLRQLGIDDFVVLERASDLGGTWRDNTYPGCACDVESHLYSFSFAPNADWSEWYSHQPEIQAYLQRCAREAGVLGHIRFEHEVRSARWSGRSWHIETSRGAFDARFLVGAAGPLSEPVIPQLPGLERFEGVSFHSARWDHAYNLSGKRVAVIGTGASAIQFVPEIQPLLAKLHLFQRTPAWVLPRPGRAITPWQRRLFRRMPALQKLARAIIYHYRELALVLFRHRALMRFPQWLALRHLRNHVRDPELRRKLTPDYAMGCKRVLLSNRYYDALAQPNVEVVTEGIAEVRAHAIVDRAGIVREVDAIVFGTGFRPMDPPLGRCIFGRGGVTLAELWSPRPQAHAGTTIAGLPNFFVLPGPNTGLGHNSVLFMMEVQIEYVLRALQWAERHGVAVLEPRAEAQAAWVRAIDRKSRGTVWVDGGCSSWYLDPAGNNSAIWPDFSWKFRRRLARFRPEEYALWPDEESLRRVAAPAAARPTAEE